MLMGAGQSFAGQQVLMEKSTPATKMSVPALFGSIILPWFIFTVVLYVRGMWLRFSFPWLSFLLAGWFLIVALVTGVMALSSAKDPKNGDPRILSLLFFLCMAAWVVAWCLGDHIFVKFTQPFYDVNNLNSYPSVNPLKFEGSQLMDAGVIEFELGAKLDMTKSIGFKNDNVYCVAPITMTNAAKDTTKFDFWAVGINCCSAHTPNFQCGEYNMPNVHKGLRLMDDEERPFFRLAVKQAEATYNIEANHPVFLHWMTDPAAEVEAYQDDAFSHFVSSTFGCFGILCVGVMAAGSIIQMTM